MCFWSDSGTPETTQTQKGDAQGGAQVNRREREVEEGVAHEAKSVDGLCHLFNFHLLVLVLVCVFGCFWPYRVLFAVYIKTPHSSH